VPEATSCIYMCLFRQFYLKSLLPSQSSRSAELALLQVMSPERLTWVGLSTRPHDSRGTLAGYNAL
jgi:hypothetical protein